MGEGDSRTLALGLPRRLTTEEEGSILRVCVCTCGWEDVCKRDRESGCTHIHICVSLNTQILLIQQPPLSSPSSPLSSSSSPTSLSSAPLLFMAEHAFSVAEFNTQLERGRNKGVEDWQKSEQWNFSLLLERIFEIISETDCKELHAAEPMSIYKYT